jgi:hypothetical protein
MMSGITHPPGEIVATPMALAALGDETVERLLARHLRGDWGECGQMQDVRLTEKVYRLGHLATSDDATLNALAIAQNEGRVLSRYRVGGQDYYVITDGLGSTEAYTAVLRTDEY